VDDDASGLFNNRQILIFKVDLERELHWSQWSRFKRADIQFNRFPAPDFVPGLFLTAFNPDRARTVEQLDLRPGQVFQAPG